MLNVTNYQRNANQNHKEILPHTCQNGHHQSTKTSVDKDMEQREPSLGMQIGTASIENSMKVPQKIKVELPYYSAIRLLHIQYPKEFRALM